MTETEAAYFAGLIDGEGSLRIFEMNQYRPVTREQYKVCHLRLSIGMTHEPTIRWLRNLTESGAIQFLDNRRHPKWRPAWIIVWSTGSAGPLLKCVLPYLILKKRNAEIALEWIELSREMRHFVGGRSRYDRVIPQHIREKRSVLLAEMQSLNRKGRQPLPS